MADNPLAPLATLGPFTGLDTFRADIFLADGKAAACSNVVSNQIGGAFSPVLGRTSGITPGASGITGPILGVTKAFLPLSNQYIVAAGPPVTASNGASLYSAPANSPTSLIAYGSFSAAVQLFQDHTMTTPLVAGDAYTTTVGGVPVVYTVTASDVTNGIDQVATNIASAINAAVLSGNVRAGAIQITIIPLFSRSDQIPLTATVGPSLTTSHTGTGQATFTVLSPFTLSASPILSPLNLTSPVSFAQYSNWVFVSNPGLMFAGQFVPPVKIDQNLTITEWGIIPPPGPQVVNFGFTVPLTFSALGTIVAGDTYRFTANGHTATYIVQAGDTQATVALGLSQQINQTLFLLAGIMSATPYVPVTGGGNGIFAFNTVTFVPSVSHTGTGTMTLTAGAVSAGGGQVGTYYYVFTYSNGLQESSPSPATGAFVSAGQLAVITIPTSTDPQVTTINAYRVGGSLGQWQFVAAYPNGLSSQFLDTQADIFVTGQNLVQHRDPPANFTAIASHKDRMWGFGVNTVYNPTPGGSIASYGPQPADLWYSTFAEPTSFDSVSQTLQVGREQSGDIAVGLSSLGSVLMAFKSKTTWMVYGSDPTSFVVLKTFDIGCVTQTSIVTAEGIVYWLATQGVYAFDGASLQYLSQDIQPTLDAFTPAQTAQCEAFYFKHCYHLSFPTSGITFIYDTIRKEWRTIALSTDASVFDVDNNEVTADRVGAVGDFDNWFSSTTDLGTPIVASYVSKVFDSPPGTVLQCHSIRVSAPVQASQQISITVTTNPGASSSGFVTTLHNLNAGTKYYTLSPQVNGTSVQITISATVAIPNLELDYVTVYGWTKRQETPLD